MSWFGWLTKPKLEVTALDILTFWAELIGAALLFVVVWVCVESVMEWWKS